MKYYSLENIKKLDNKLYDMFYPMLKDNPQHMVYEYIIDEKHEMRIDLISKDIYGTTIYSDELLHINSIVDPLSMKKGDIIYYVNLDDLRLYKSNYNRTNELTDDYNSNNNIRINNKYSKFDKSKKLPITTDNSHNQVLYDKNRNSIKIINKII